MNIARGSRFAAIRRPRLRRQRRRGQMLMMFAFGLMTIMLMAALLVDGAMMIQVRSSLAVVTHSAGRAGAQEVNYALYTARCTVAYRNTNGTCNTPYALQINAGPANSEAQRVAGQWLTQMRTQFGLPLSNPISGSWVSSSVSGNLITVTVRQCYRPFFGALVRSNSAACGSNGVLITESATTRAPGGY